MKKAKLTLALVCSLAATGALAACNEVTAKDGIVLTYTDAQGTRVDYSAKDLFESYQTNSSAASTDFDKVYEILIRNYYESPSMAATLASLKTKAQNDVDDVKKTAKDNADNNNTTYQSELESLLKNNGVDNVNELYDKKLYEEEKSQFESDYYSDTKMAAIRDGKDASGHATFPADTTEGGYGIGSEGYLKEKMPYHVSHVLVKFGSAGANDFTSATISESEAKKVSQVIMEFAGANENDVTGKTPLSADKRINFGSIAFNLSEDTGSAASYGDLGIMENSESYIQEFKYGVFAYDAIYNQETNAYADGVKSKLLPSATKKYLSKGEETNVKQSFTDRGIGTIPYGAAIALLNSAKDPDLAWTVNDNSSAYYPRNVLFNKYFNNHQVAVITPNRVDYNDFLDAGKVDGWTSATSAWNAFSTSEGVAGVHDDDYAALPGFQVNTSSILPGINGAANDNVLTTEKGQIILAVRGGSSDYQGIHFIVVNRSALSEYGVTFDETAKTVTQNTAASATADITSLSDYYTMKIPGQDGYPKTDAGASKTTFINYGIQTVDKNYQSRATTVKNKVKGYISSEIDSYIFQELVTDQSITFHDAQIEKTIKSYIRAKRSKAAEDTIKSFDEGWATYAETLDRQDEARAWNADGSQKLISETCAIGYNSDEAKNGTGLWAKGGACYDGK